MCGIDCAFHINSSGIDLYTKYGVVEMKKKKTRRKKITIGGISWIVERSEYSRKLRKAGIKDVGLKYRCSGRTTARAFEYIALAITHPEQFHTVTDHGTNPSRETNLNLLQVVLFKN